MKLLDYSKLTGWPASTSTWKFQQEQMLQLQLLSLLGGTNYILSGCHDGGGVTGNGFVVIDGEVLPFIGGPTQTSVVVVDTTTNRSFFDSTINPYYHERIATFGIDTIQYAWANFEVNDPANGLLLRMRVAEGLLTSLQAALAATNANVASKADEINVLQLDNANAYVPAQQYHPATKGYVDAALNVPAKGYAHIGAISAGIQHYDIPLGLTLASNNYKIIGTIVNNNSNNAETSWYIDALNKTTTSFRLYIHGTATTTMDIFFDWMIIAN